MCKSVLYMSMSLDGYIAGPNDKPGNPGGDDFMRLHDWYGFATDAGPTAETTNTSEVGKQFLDEIRETGAVSWCSLRAVMLSARSSATSVDFCQAREPASVRLATYFGTPLSRAVNGLS